MGETTPERRLRLTRTIVLVGMMGAGKTAVGKVIASRLGARILDSDAEIVESARLSIAEIFDRFGEAFFREKETQVIARLLQGPPCVLSTGGGAWMSAANRAQLAQKASVLWLDADLDLLWQRVRHKTTRPLLRTSDPRATLEHLLAERRPFYALAPLRLHIDPHWSIDETARRVLAVLQDDGAVEEA